MNILEKIFKKTVRIMRTAEYLPMGIVIHANCESDFCVGDQVLFDDEKTCIIHGDIVLAHDSHLERIM